MGVSKRSFPYNSSCCETLVEGTQLISASSSRDAKGSSSTPLIKSLPKAMLSNVPSINRPRHRRDTNAVSSVYCIASRRIASPCWRCHWTKIETCHKGGYERGDGVTSKFVSKSSQRFRLCQRFIVISRCGSGHRLSQQLSSVIAGFILTGGSFTTQFSYWGSWYCSVSVADNTQGLLHYQVQVSHLSNQHLSTHCLTK